MKKTFDQMTIEDLKILRGEIKLNSIWLNDYENSFGFIKKSMGAFFDGYVSYIKELAEEDGYNDWDTYEQLFETYDTEDNLFDWYNCFDDYDWVEYEDDDEL